MQFNLSKTFLSTALIVLSSFAHVSCFAGSTGKASAIDNNTNDGKLATSVFVASDRHDQGNGNNLKAVLSSAVNDKDAVIPSVVLLGGDYVGGGRMGGTRPMSKDSLGRQGMPGHGEHHSMSDGHRPSMSDGQHPTMPEHGKKPPFSQRNPEFTVTTMQNEIDSAMAGHPHVNLFTYGSHDIAAKEGYDAFFSGPYAADGYYLYGISYAQMIYDTADSTYNGIDRADSRGCCAMTATENFNKWVTSLTDNKPIIIMSHVPIHVLRNDNEGGERWYQTISKAAEKHDILLLFCHNHTMEESGKTEDRLNYLLVPGDSIKTQGVIVKGDHHNMISSATYGHKLNFYYGNAGYLKHGYGTLITFRRDNPTSEYKTMTLKRYSVIDPTPTVMGDTDKTNPYTITLSYTK